MKFKFTIKGLDCPNCAAKLSAMMQNINGVESAKINFLTEKLTVEADLDAKEALAELRECAKKFDKSIKIEE